MTSPRIPRIEHFHAGETLVSPAGYSVHKGEFHGRPAVLRLFPTADARLLIPEIAALAELEHRGIARLLSVGRDGNHVYLIREWRDGAPVSAAAPVPLETAVQYLFELASILGEVHARGFVHLDVTNSNIIIEKGTGLPVLLDFGLAERVSGPVRQGFRGTAFFAAPESILGIPVDARADLFSLGVLAAEWMLGGFKVSPDSFYGRFPHTSFFEAAGVDLTQIPSRLRPWILTMTAVSPAARPPSMREAARLLARAFPGIHSNVDPAASEGGRVRLGCTRSAPRAAAVLMERLTPHFKTGDGMRVCALERFSDANDDAVRAEVRLAAALAGALFVEIEPASARTPGGMMEIYKRLGLAKRALPKVDGLPAADVRRTAIHALARAVADAASDRPVVVLMKAGSDGETTAPGDGDAAACVAAIRDLARYGCPGAIVYVHHLCDVAADDIEGAPAISVETIARDLADLGFRGTGDAIPGFSRKLLASAGPSPVALEDLLNRCIQSGIVSYEEGAFFVAGSPAQADLDALAPQVEDEERQGSPARRLDLILRIAGCPVPRALLLEVSELAEPSAQKAMAEGIQRGRIVARIDPASNVSVISIRSGVAPVPIQPLPAPADIAGAARCVLKLSRRMNESYHSSASVSPVALARAALLAGEYAEALAHARVATGAGGGLSGQSGAELLRVVVEMAAPGPEVAFELLHSRLRMLSQSMPLDRIEGDFQQFMLPFEGQGELHVRAVSAVAAIWHAHGYYQKAVDTLAQCGSPLDWWRRGRGEPLHIFAAANLSLGNYEESVEALNAALAGPAQKGMESLQIRLRVVLAVAFARLGLLQKSIETSQKALESAHAARDDEPAAAALLNLGFVYDLGRDYNHAVGALRESKDLYHRLGLVSGEAAASHHLGISLRKAGEREEAEVHLREALSIRARQQDVAGAAATRGSLGALHVERGELLTARRLLSDAIATFVAIGAKREEAMARVLLARALRHSSRFDEAMREAGIAIGALRAAGESVEFHDAICELTLALIAAGRQDAAAVELRRIPQTSPRGLFVHACFCEAARNYPEAREFILRLSTVERGDGLLRDGAAACLLGMIELQCQQLEAAEAALDESIQYSRQTGGRHTLLRALVARAAVWMARGDVRACNIAMRDVHLELDRARIADDPEVTFETLLDPATCRLKESIEHKLQNELRAPSSTAPFPATPTTNISTDFTRTILNINRRIAKSADYDQILRYLIETALAVTNARRAFLAVFRNERIIVEEYISVESTDFRPPDRELSKSIVREAVRTRRPVITSNARTDQRFIAMKSVHSLDLRSIACVPFLGHEQFSGAIYVDNALRDGAFSEQSVDMLEALADQVSIVLGMATISRSLAAREDKATQDNPERVSTKGSAGREKAKPTIPALVAESASMKSVLAAARRVAPTGVPVLILGESGVGKEVLARDIHTHSLNADGKFVAIHCAAMPEQLLESELFGHVRGAFSGADRDHSGLVEAADGGTLFLDEIGEMPSAIQAKVLRFLQNGEFRRVGGQHVQHSSSRVLSATNRNMVESISNGSFREDLYFRLRGVELVVPPLRERVDDIAPLALGMIERLNLKHSGSKTIGRVVLSELKRRPWPGNVRELENTIELLFHLSDGVIDRILPEVQNNGLARPSAAPASVVRELRTLEEIERDAIQLALAHTGGNRDQAARLLGISRTTIYDKIRKFGFQ